MEEKRHLSDKFMLRLPDGMRDRIKDAADLNGRSMNSEIVATLEEEYPPFLGSPDQKRFRTLLVKYLNDHSNFTVEDQAELNTLTSTLRLSDGTA
jgi:hypothetical protein